MFENPGHIFRISVGLRVKETKKRGNLECRYGDCQFITIFALSHAHGMMERNALQFIVGNGTTCL
jgi:hypothetical protein